MTIVPWLINFLGTFICRKRKHSRLSRVFWVWSRMARKSQFQRRMDLYRLSQAQGKIMTLESERKISTDTLSSTIRHRFWAHASSKEDLIFKVWVEPQDADFGFDEDFMRNFSSYLKDCEKYGMAPSIFQMLLFLYHSDMVLTPPFWMPIWFLVGLHHVLAYWVGAGLLGYVYRNYLLNRMTDKVVDINQAILSIVQQPARRRHKTLPSHRHGGQALNGYQIEFILGGLLWITEAFSVRSGNL